MSDNAASAFSVQLPLLYDAPERGWIVRRSARARRLSARVHRDGRVDIVVPQRVRIALVDEFIQRHRTWIDAKVAQARALAPPPAQFPPDAIAMPALDRVLSVRRIHGERALRVRLSGDCLEVRGFATNPEQLRAALRRWLARYARVQIEPLLQQAANAHAFRYTSMSVRRQRTRWGSCSRRGHISLNVCALFQSPAVLNYLLLHELTHTVHMNHSSQYWERVAVCCPQWRALDRELRYGWQHVPQWLVD